jgi:hypothetical protein
MDVVNFQSVINSIKERTKNGELDRETRIELIVGLLANVIEPPDEYELKALADLILYEELSDKRKNKISVEEYPILSDLQLARRQTGVHQRKPKPGDLPNPVEVPLSWAENYGTDGRNYRYPSRRKRTDFENLWMDEMTVSRNKERRKTYNDFKYGRSTGVFTVNIQTGEKTIHNEEKYTEVYGFGL